MTATELSRPPAAEEDRGSVEPPTSASPAPTTRPTGPARPERAAVVRAVTATVALAGAVLLGFVVFLFALSDLSESRSQNVMYKNFARALREAVAPVGPVAPGTPVAVMDIPSLSIVHLVVVEGTQARQLTGGPGHSRSTPLPGQAGVSVLFGRRATFGAPFAGLDQLRAGDTISVTTGQGISRYVVKASGGGAHPPKDTAANRLVMVTADSSFVPSTTLTVSADLTSKVHPSGGGLPTVDDSEMPMRGGAGQAVLALMLWGQALIIVAVVATVAVRRWSKWPAYVGLAPVALAVLWNIYENAALLLPNLY